ncbi:hypothetical protein GGI07_004201 [Coemansia sp. Benny D115]|nr:hypothetical protein GGI07_004201 [Coemansia sp. Benny D115]
MPERVSSTASPGLARKRGPASNWRRGQIPPSAPPSVSNTPPATPTSRIRSAVAAAAAAFSPAAPSPEPAAGEPLAFTPKKTDRFGSPARRFDRTPTSTRRKRATSVALDKAPVFSFSARVHRTDSATSDRASFAAPVTPTRASKHAAPPASLLSLQPAKTQFPSQAEFTFRSPPIAAAAAAPTAEFPSLLDAHSSSPFASSLPHATKAQQRPQHLEFVGAALLPSLSRRATISERKHTSLRIGTSRRAATLRPMATELDTTIELDNESRYAPDDAPLESPPQLVLSPRYECSIPNDNENDGQYATEFWLNAFVPKPHTNFFGYSAATGAICISISTRESHECYKVLVRTPFKFGIVYVPVMVLKEPSNDPDLERLANPTPQKLLLFHALRLFLQQADEERCGYLLTALRNQRLLVDSQSAELGVSSAGLASTTAPADALWGRSITEAMRDAGVAATADSPDRFGPSSLFGKKRGLQRSNTKRSIELRRAEINDFMDGLFKTCSNAGSAMASDTSASQASTLLAESTNGDSAALIAEIHAFLEKEQQERDLAVATESLTEIRDDHLKPLLRNLEPQLFRRRLRIDFVVHGANGASQLSDVSAPHRRFLRTLERTDMRMREDSGAAAKASAKADPHKPEAKSDAATAQRTKTREQLEAKRKNIIQELIATERSYVEKLRALIDIYVVPLRSAARSANNALIPAYHAHVIFGNIERVTEINERFLGDLEAWNAGEMDPRETIGSLCRDHFVDFHVYKRYINGYQHALASSRELEAKNPLYSAFLQRAREREECRKLDISDLLIMPVQRIPRYTLLLADLLKATPHDDEDAACIELAMERVNEIGQLADNQVSESVEELHRIHTTIEDCPPNLISASREFIGAVDASEIELATGAPKRPVCLLVFSDLLMIVERFWPPRDHGGLRVTGQTTSSNTCPIHAGTGTGTGTTTSNTGTDATAGYSAESKAGCTCSPGSGSGAGMPWATSFLSTTSDSSRGKRWGRFAGWVDITRLSTLEKSLNTPSRSFYIHRHPDNNSGMLSPAALGADDARAPGAMARLRAATAAASATLAQSANPSGQRSSASSIVSLDSGASASPAMTSEMLQHEFSRILYPVESTYESYGDHGYWFPQSLHEFEVDHPHTRDALYEFLNTAWERSVARCFEKTSSLSRQGSSSSNSAAASRGHRKTKSGVEALQPAMSTSVGGHPELDRVDVCGQSWSVRIWDAADYARSRHNCPSALVADMTVVWDYSQAGSPDLSGASASLSASSSAGTSASPVAYCPLQACRVVDFGDDYFHVASTVLPLDMQQRPDALEADACAELMEEREVADNWLSLCRLVQQAVINYQYVLLAYPEHRRVQQCYNRSILASLFGQNALATSSSIKAETAVSAAPRKLFSRARHLFSSGKSRSSGLRSQRGAAESTTSNIFTSAYSNAVAADTIGPSSSQSPYNSHSAISTPLTVLGRYKLKNTVSSSSSSTRRAATQVVSAQESSVGKSASAGTTPSRSNVLHGIGTGQFAKPSLTGSATFSAGDASMFSLTTTSSSTSTRLSPIPDSFPAGLPESHTADEFPSFSSTMLGDESVDIRARSQTNWEQRTRAASSISSMAQISPPRLPATRLLGTRKSKDGLGLLPLNLSGSSPSLVKLAEQEASLREPTAKRSDLEAYTKRRSMSVVSAVSVSSNTNSLRGGTSTFGLGSITAERQLHNGSGPGNASLASIGSAASTTAPNSGTRGLQGDSESEFSLGIDMLPPHNERLEIPSDLQLEFDTALSGASNTPPRSTHGLVLDTQAFALPFASAVSASLASAAASVEAESRADGESITGMRYAPSGGAGLSVLIPTSGNLPSAASTWDIVSPEEDMPSEPSAHGSVSSGMFSASLSRLSNAMGSVRSVDRRRGVYGVPPLSAGTAPRSPLTPVAAEPLIRPQVLFSEADILLDIARELGEDEPFNRPSTINSLYVDDDDMARHLGQLALGKNRPQTSAGGFGQLNGPVSPIYFGGASGPTSPVQPESPRPLPSVPHHSKSLNYGTDRNTQHFGTIAPPPAWATPQSNRIRIPHPPSALYSFQQHQQHQQQQPLSGAGSDYRRLPSLPPRVRSAAASSYLDRSPALNGGSPSSSVGRTSQPACPPF